MNGQTTLPHVLPRSLPSLDGVRAIAITLVLIHTCNILKEWSDPLGHLLSRVAGMGWVGVQLFFVLSGFLITRNLLQTQNSSKYYHSFYGRRILRIFPLYYATLFFFFILLPVIDLAPQAVRDDIPRQWGLWLFLSNWTQQLGYGGLSLPHFWSLAVEEQFYLIWPLVVRHHAPKKLLKICSAITLLSLLIRIAMVSAGSEPLLIYTSSLCRMDALALGSAVAALVQLPGALKQLVERRAQLLALAAALILVGKLIPQGFGMTDPIGQTLGYSLLGGIFAILMAIAIVGECLPTNIAQRLLKSAPLKAVGKYSFAIYVFHAPLNTYVGHAWLEQIGWATQPTTLQAVIYLGVLASCSYVMAWLSYQLMEHHFLKLKKYFIA
jgi:peptidoglycan/LPS O-acetylase OafA/YrhL